MSPSAVGGGQGSKGHFVVALEGWDNDTKLLFSTRRSREIHRLSPQEQGDGEGGTCRSPWSCVGHGFDLKKNKQTKKPKPKPFVFTNNLFLNDVIYINIYLCRNKNGTRSVNSSGCVQGLIPEASRSSPASAASLISGSQVSFMLFSSVKS